MNSKRLAVFAASVQWADAVKVMSRGTPRSRTSVTWGIRWSVSAAENDGESGGRLISIPSWSVRHFTAGVVLLPWETRFGLL